ncbi:hypothetical protein Tco_0471469 [Tanacetum coccineum]
MASNPENVRLTVLMKLQEALDEEAILEEQMLALMHHFADRFTNRRVEINNLMPLNLRNITMGAIESTSRTNGTNQEEEERKQKSSTVVGAAATISAVGVAAFRQHRYPRN